MVVFLTIGSVIDLVDFIVSFMFIVPVAWMQPINGSARLGFCFYSLLSPRSLPSLTPLALAVIAAIEITLAHI